MGYTHRSCVRSDQLNALCNSITESYHIMRRFVQPSSTAQVLPVLNVVLTFMTLMASPSSRLWV